MDSRRSTISVLMGIVLLTAIDLAMLRMVPTELLRPPPPILLFAFVALNLMVVQAVILRRPLRPRQATFLVVGLAYFVGLTAYTVIYSPGVGRNHLAPLYLEFGLRLYRLITGDYQVFRLNNSAWFLQLELIVANAVGFLVAWGSGVGIERVLRGRPGRRMARLILAVGDFFAGAVIGLFFQTLVVSLARIAGWSPEPPPKFLMVSLSTMSIVLGGATMTILRRRRRARPARPPADAPRSSGPDFQSSRTNQS